jgi:hypothetical protein
MIAAPREPTNSFPCRLVAAGGALKYVAVSVVRKFDNTAPVNYVSRGDCLLSRLFRDDSRPRFSHLGAPFFATKAIWSHSLLMAGSDFRVVPEIRFCRSVARGSEQ